MAMDTDYELWLEVEHGSPDSGDDPLDNAFTMQVIFADDRVYALNVWTLDFVRRSRTIQESESPAMVGKYLVAPDLFVESLDRAHIEDVVADIVATGQLRDDWLVDEEGSA